MDTIFALSSGPPPAAIAIVRVSGPLAAAALRALAQRLPHPRIATVCRLCAADGGTLDRALTLWLPGPDTVTGEDLAELHLHGGRAVVSAVEAALASVPGLRRAQAGEFTRRAFANGRIDLAEAEGLADLLEAETELQRAAAIAAAGGGLSRQVGEWRERLLTLAAQVEAALDFAEEDDVADLPPTFARKLDRLAADIEEAVAAPTAELLRQGFRVALAGPPNSGKSTLFNTLVDAEAAIATPIAGTTRDVLERSVAIEGIPFVFVDMAGLREASADPVEMMGIARAHAAIGKADRVLWLGYEGTGPGGAWEIEPQIDRRDHSAKRAPRHRVSAVTRAGVPGLLRDLVEEARSALPKPGQAALNQRQRRLLADAGSALRQCAPNLLIAAENLRIARQCFERLVGLSATEDVLDALFGRFCIGK